MAKSKIDIRHILIESFLIVFTVLLALALSEWRSNLKEERTKEVVLNNILQEIRDNQSDLKEKMEYHNQMSQKMGQYLNSDSLWSTLQYESAIEAIIQIMDRGIQVPELQSTAWRSAELSGVVNSFDYETIYVLSNVYKVQEEGPNSTWKQLAAFFSDPTSYDKGTTRRLTKMMQLGFGELYAQERSLIYTYEKALESLDDNQN